MQDTLTQPSYEPANPGLDSPVPHLSPAIFFRPSPKKLRILASMHFFLIVFGGILVSCGDSGPGGYLFTNDQESMFIQFTATGQDQQQLSGDMSIVEENTNVTPPKVTSSSEAFTGVKNGSALTITLSFFGMTESYNGTLNGDTLILDLPQSDGSMQANKFVSSSLDQYNQVVAALQQKVGNQDQQYNNSQATAAAAQATADIQQQDQQATATAQQQAQSAVQSANQQLVSDLSSLKQDSPTLAQLSESSTLDEYAKTWQQMQNDYATEQKQAQQGCGDNNSNQYQVSSDAYQVDSDNYQISSDDYQLNSDKNQYDQENSSVQTDIQRTQDDWKTLKQAISNNPGGTPGAAYSDKDIQSAIDQGNKAISTAQSIWGNAQSNASQYDQEASALQKKADALPDSMNCP